MKPFIVEEASKTDYAALAERLKVTPGSASIAVYRLRTRFRHFIRDEVLATVADADAESVEAEFLDLFGIGGR